MLFIPVLAVTAMIAWLAYSGRLEMSDVSVAQVNSEGPLDGALAIARARLARGEITLEDFDRISVILRD